MINRADQAARQVIMAPGRMQVRKDGSEEFNLQFSLHGALSTGTLYARAPGKWYFAGDLLKEFGRDAVDDVIAHIVAPGFATREHSPI